MDKPKILKNLDALNTLQKTKIRARKGKKGWSLYLDRRIKGQPVFRENLNIMLSGSNSQKSFQEDQSKLAIVGKIRDLREKEFQEGKTSSFDEHKYFLKYFEDYAQRKTISKSTSNSDFTVIKHFKDFAREKCKTDPSKLKFKDIDKRMISEFVKYLSTNIALSENTLFSYFHKVKTLFKHAEKEEIVAKNPTTHIQLRKKDTEINYLTLEEQRELFKVSCKHENIKKAFMFGCFTGLRYSDIRLLKYSKNIANRHIIFRQTKTKTQNRFELNEQAYNIIQEQHKKNGEDLFPLPDNSSANKIIKKWVFQANIHKRITFHCSRHTYATTMLTSGADIYTISKILGHSSLQQTQKYAKIIDEAKDSVSKRYPDILINELQL